MYVNQRIQHVVHTFICEFPYVFNLYCDRILFESSSRYPERNGVYMLREIFCGCPACTSDADVSVRKSHETLRRRRLLESHGLSETPIAWGNTPLCVARDIRLLCQEKIRFDLREDV